MNTKQTYRTERDGERTQWLLLGVVFVLSSLFVALELTRPADADGDISDEGEQAMADAELSPLDMPDDMIALVPREEPRAAEELNIVDDAPPEADLPQEATGTTAETALPDEQDDTTPLPPVATDMDEHLLDFRVVEELPEFPGGAVEFVKWLTKNLKYPPSAQNQRVQGKVMAQFIVNTDGTVSDLRIAQSLNAACDREALRVLRLMPRWRPGQQEGKPCRTMVCLPIVFKL